MLWSALAERPTMTAGLRPFIVRGDATRVAGAFTVPVETMAWLGTVLGTPSGSATLQLATCSGTSGQTWYLPV